MSRLIFEDTESMPGVKQQLYGKEEGDLEVFADGVWGSQLHNGIVKVNFVTVAPQDGNEIQRKEVAVRLVMPVGMFLALEGFVRDFKIHLEELQQQQIERQQQESEKPNENHIQR